MKSILLAAIIIIMLVGMYLLFRSFVMHDTDCAYIIAIAITYMCFITAGAYMLKVILKL